MTDAGMIQAFNAALGVWLALEIVLAVRQRANRADDQKADRGSEVILWGALLSALTLASVTRTLDFLDFPVALSLRLGAGITLISIGLVVRWTAVLTLGRYFTTSVAVREGHRIVKTGLYRWLRHPSYTGLYLICIGAGIGFGNWMSLGLCAAVPFGALAYRTIVEEQALRSSLGVEYVEYSAQTYRFIPWLY